MAEFQSVCCADWKSHGKNAMAYLVHTTLSSAFLLSFFFVKQSVEKYDLWLRNKARDDSE